MPAGDPYVTHEVDGKQYRFRKMTVYDRRELVRRDRAPRRQVLKQDMLDVGTDKDTIVQTLQEFDAAGQLPSALYEAFDSVDGKVNVFELATSTLKLDNGLPVWERRPDAQACIDYIASLDALGQQNVSFELCGLRPVERGGDEEDAENPTAGGAAATGAREMTTARP